MKKMIYLFLITLLLIGCNKEINNDFWITTLQALETSNVNSSWEIGIQDASFVEDKDHRSVRITKQNENSRVTYALQNYNEKYISYTYETTSKISHTTYTETIDYSIVIKSIDTSYKTYSISYIAYIYHDNAYFDTKQYNGTIQLVNDKDIIYDNVPYLKESIEAFYTLLETFQKDFNIEYSQTDYVPIISYMYDSNIPEYEENATSSLLEYYSEERISAKGYRMITFVKLDKTANTLQYGEYCYEQNAYSFNYYLPLQERELNNLYNLVLNDAQTPYALYICEDKAYLYPQSFSDQEIYNDIYENNANNASLLLYKGNNKF